VCINLYATIKKNIITLTADRERETSFLWFFWVWRDPLGALLPTLMIIQPNLCFVTCYVCNHSFPPAMQDFHSSQISTQLLRRQDRSSLYFVIKVTAQAQLYTYWPVTADTDSHLSVLLTTINKSYSRLTNILQKIVPSPCWTALVEVHKCIVSKYSREDY
jgi:hypothetical protein